MVKIYTIEPNYCSLEKLKNYLSKHTQYPISITHDKWVVRKDENSQIAKCIMIRKNRLNAILIYFINEEQIYVMHTIPNSLLYAYFGEPKSDTTSPSKLIFRIISKLIIRIFLKSKQKAAFHELTKILRPIQLKD